MPLTPRPATSPYCAGIGAGGGAGLAAGCIPPTAHSQVQSGCQAGKVGRCRAHHGSRVAAGDDGHPDDAWVQVKPGAVHALHLGRVGVGCERGGLRVEQMGCILSLVACRGASGRRAAGGPVPHRQQRTRVPLHVHPHEGQVREVERVECLQGAQRRGCGHTSGCGNRSGSSAAAATSSQGTQGCLCPEPAFVPPVPPATPHPTW